MSNHLGDPIPQTLSAAARFDYGARLALFYAALFIIYGSQLPHLPLWLHWQGLTAAEIALVTATPFFLRVFITPLVAIRADSLNNHRQMTIWIALVGLLFTLLLSRSVGFWAIYLSAVPFALCASTIMPLTETIAVRGVRFAGLDYGRMRLWGSLTFVATGYIGGALIGVYGPEGGMWCLLAGAMATALMAFLLPSQNLASPDQNNDQEYSRGPASPQKAPVSKSDALRLLKCPLFVLFLIGSGAIQGAHGMFYAFGSLHWHSQGISATWVGTLWAIGVAAEIMLFAFSGKAARYFGPEVLMITACVCGILRWTLMAADPPLPMLAVMQLLHAATYGASHLGAMHFIANAVPQNAQGTAQACYATVAAGLVMGLTTMIAGGLYPLFGGQAYFAMAGVSAIGLAACLILAQRWDGSLLWTDEELSASPK